ncbi:hypothetical protein GALMADRAFT_729060 [Galerina marginata CBS 339.88]|uniref:ATP-dependent RNA helicase n=1 Tax=Galerina marginata (strain CBS 339.88) TaxID=685588 RepID=A0A067T2P2_GALM3|nr:hypothetical protein GALMADRAFT_729060 [Galerina marginata CBS 339.88]
MRPIASVKFQPRSKSKPRARYFFFPNSIPSRPSLHRHCQHHHCPPPPPRLDLAGQKARYMSSLVSRCLNLRLHPTVNPTRCLHLHLHRRALRITSKPRLPGSSLRSGNAVLFHSSARRLGARNPSTPRPRPRPKLASPSSVSSGARPPFKGKDNVSGKDSVKGKGKGKPKTPKPDLPWVQRGNQRARKEANKTLSLSPSRFPARPRFVDPGLGEQFAFSGQRPGFRPGFNSDRPPPTTTPLEEKPKETNEDKTTRLGLIKAQKARVRREKDPRVQAELLGRMGVDPGVAVEEGKGADLEPERMQELVRREELREGRGRGRGRGGGGQRGPIRGGGGVERDLGVSGYEPPYRREVEERAGVSRERSAGSLGSFRAREDGAGSSSSSYAARDRDYRGGDRAPPAGQGGYEPPYRRDLGERTSRSSSPSLRDSAGSGSSSYTPRNRDHRERTPSSYRRSDEGQERGTSGSYTPRDRARDVSYRSNHDRSSTSPSTSPSAYRHDDKDLGRGRTRYESDSDSGRARVRGYNPPNANAKAADADANARDGYHVGQSSASSFTERKSGPWSGTGSGSSSSYTPDRYRERNRERASVYPSGRSTPANAYEERDYDAPEGNLLPDEALAQGQSEFFHPSHPITTSVPVPIPDKKHPNTKPNDYIPTAFTSPPLLPGFLSALKELFGDGVRATPIQGLSLRWVVGALGGGGRDEDAVQGAEWKEPTGGKKDGREVGKEVGKEVEGKEKNAVLSEAEQVLQETAADAGAGAAEGAVEAAVPVSAPVQVTVPALAQPQVQVQGPPGGWRQFLLASETGSGKSIAYLLPVLQHLKSTESSLSHSRLEAPAYPPRPRALVLAPTHELARQLAGFAKELVRFPDTRLRVMCGSRANSGTKGGDREDKGRKAVLDGMERVVYDTDVDIDLGSVVRKRRTERERAGRTMSTCSLGRL